MVGHGVCSIANGNSARIAVGDQLVNAVGDHVMRAIVLSGIAALVIVGLVALAWWQARRSIRARFDAQPAGDRARSVKEMNERGGAGTSAPGDETSGHGPGASYDRPEENWGSRIVRDAATRAAAMRDTWDRSYHPARTSDHERQPVRDPDRGELGDLIAELRKTNELLRDLVTQLRTRR